MSAADDSRQGLDFELLQFISCGPGAAWPVTAYSDCLQCLFMDTPLLN